MGLGQKQYHWADGVQKNASFSSVPSQGWLTSSPPAGLEHPKTLRGRWDVKRYFKRNVVLTGLVQQPVQIVASHDLTLFVRPTGHFETLSVGSVLFALDHASRNEILKRSKVLLAHADSGYLPAIDLQSEV